MSSSIHRSMTLSSNSLLRVAKSLTTLAAIAYILIWIVLAVVRAAYPFELEWMEGEMVDHVRWLLAGNPLYAEPSMEFISSIYTPLYFYVSSLFTLFTEEGYFPLRLVSIFSTVGCLWLICLFVRRATGRWSYGLIAAGAFAATYRAGGSWFDLARVDMLALLLAIAALYLIRFRETIIGWSLAGALLALSVLTKQSFLLAAIAVLCFGFFRERKIFLAGIFSFSLLLIGSALALNINSGGWFWFYTMEVPSQQEVFLSYPIKFFRHDLMGVLPVGMAAGLFLLLLPRDRQDRHERWFYVLAASGFLLSALFPGMKIGGYDNSLIPAYLILAILFGVGLAESLNRVPQTMPYLQSFIWSLCLLQFSLFAYRADLDIPTKAESAANRHLIERLRSIEGEMYMPSHGYLSALAGHKTFTHIAPLQDILWCGDSATVHRLTLELDSFVFHGDLKAIILDQPFTGLSDSVERKIQSRFGPPEEIPADETFSLKNRTFVYPAYIYSVNETGLLP
jgi:hypothetical protein